MLVFRCFVCLHRSCKPYTNCLAVVKQGSIKSIITIRQEITRGRYVADGTFGTLRSAQGLRIAQGLCEHSGVCVCGGFMVCAWACLVTVPACALCMRVAWDCR